MEAWSHTLASLAISQNIVCSGAGLLTFVCVCGYASSSLCVFVNINEAPGTSQDILGKNHLSQNTETDEIGTANAVWLLNFIQ